MAVNACWFRFVIACVATIAWSAQAQVASSPAIMMNGSNIAGQTVTVVTGEQITLTSAGGSGETWQIVGGNDEATLGLQISGAGSCPTWSATQSTSLPSCVTYSAFDGEDPFAGSTSLSFYYLGTGESILQYTYGDSGGVHEPTVTFDVVGPTNVNVASAEASSITIYPNPTNASQVSIEFGNSTLLPTVPGITLTATATQPPGYSGSFVWSQTVNDALDYEPPGGETQYSCGPAFGSDNGFPYASVMTNTGIANYITNNTVTDAPTSNIPQGYAFFERDFQAEIELAWQPNMPNSIPVVIGRTFWGFDFQVTSNGATYTQEGLEPQEVETSVGGGGQFSSWADILPTGYTPVCSMAPS